VVCTYPNVGYSSRLEEPEFGSEASKTCIMLFDGLEEVAIGVDISKIDLAERFEVHSSVNAKLEKRWSMEIIDTGDRCSFNVIR